MIEKNIPYTHTNTYSTLNELSEKTKNIWFVFHGMGYLSRYFINYFKELPPEENYIIAPQAPSKYYQDKRFKYVGASWLTKENTETEKDNVFNYLDELWYTELATIDKSAVNVIMMGYSQGVSIVTRWIASRKIDCSYLLLHSGAIPAELNPTDFEHLSTTTPVTYIYGDKDEYITEARVTEQHLNGSALFGNRLEVVVFSGIHEVHTAFFPKILTALEE
ncbi:alpha/beta hydrolase [Dokdonia sp. Asnod1-B02]|uniref:alpha/beta hydrolase n=1 Tax=Dokdonia sp. Asnod1-B02 TaxID=3160573 RepID=UPI00386A721B